MSLNVMKLFAVFVVVFCVVGQKVDGANRLKRTISESRMKNMETLIAMGKYKKSRSSDPLDLENQFYETVKRVSAPVVSDLQTKIALKNNIKGLAITMPIAGGKLDPWMIGRKRRSDSKFLTTLLNQQSENDNSDLLQQDYDNSLFSYSFIH